MIQKDCRNFMTIQAKQVNVKNKLIEIEENIIFLIHRGSLSKFIKLTSLKYFLVILVLNPPKFMFIFIVHK